MDQSRKCKCANAAKPRAKARFESIGEASFRVPGGGPRARVAGGKVW